MVKDSPKDLFDGFLILNRLLGGFFSMLFLNAFRHQFWVDFFMFFQEPTFKIHAPTQCFVNFYSVSPFLKKSPKITENSPKILSKSLPKPPKIEEKSQKIVTKMQDNLRCVKKSKKWATRVNNEPQEPHKSTDPPGSPTFGGSSPSQTLPLTCP